MILEEYLVKLGFKLDDESYRRFTSGTERAAKSAFDLGLTVAGAAAVVAVSIEKIARQYDQLYFASQRTKASVADIKSSDFAFRQIGLTADQNRAAIEGMAQSIRMNPGLQGLLKNMGINTDNAQHAGVQLVGKLKQQFGEGGYFVAARMAQMYGMDELTFKQMWTNYESLKGQQDAYNKRLKESGVDTQKLSKQSREFSQALDGLEASLGMVADQTAQKWLPSMKDTVTWLDSGVRWVVRMGKETDGWSSTVLSLVAALGSLKAASGLLGMFGMGGAAAAAGALPKLAGKAVAGGGVMGLGAMALGGMKADAESGHHVRSYLRNLLGIEDPKEAAPWQKGGAWDKKGQAIDYFMKQGWTKQQATGIAASLHGESKFDPQAFNPAGGGKGAVGIGQWRGDRQDQFRKLFGKDLRSASFEEQLAFVQWELQNTQKGAGDMIKGAGSAGQAAMLHSRLYERHGNVAEDQRRAALANKWFGSGPIGDTTGGGGTTVTVSQKTDIHVAAGANATDTAAKVADSQGRVNGDIVRNVTGAVR